MIENLKNLVSEMTNKSDFVEKVAQNYGLSYIYVLQTWFQSRWAVPKENLSTIIKMAQNNLYNQTKRQRDLLVKTKYKVND